MGIFSRNSSEKALPTNDNEFVNKENGEPPVPTIDKAYGKIMKLNKSEAGGGYGFISSKDIPFTRIFFHWSGLVPDTLPFLELEDGMEVEFKPIRWNDGRYRAIKVRVIPHDSNEND